MLPRIPLPGLPFGLPAYGLMVALGFVAALWLAERLGRRHGFAPLVVQDTAVWACLWGLVGAKLALLVVEPPPLADLWRIAFQGGVFYGGFAGAVAAVLWRCHRRRLDPHALGDVLAAPLALGHAFGRLGCFLAGCCFGSRCDRPWAVHFDNPASIPVEAGIPPSVGLHPVQLYESAANLVLMAACLLLLRHRRFPGQVFWTYVAAYGLLRFAVEHWRGDARGSLGPFSTSQAAGMLALSCALVVLGWRAARHRRDAGRDAAALAADDEARASAPEGPPAPSSP